MSKLIKFGAAIVLGLMLALSVFTSGTFAQSVTPTTVIHQTSSGGAPIFTKGQFRDGLFGQTFRGTENRLGSESHSARIRCSRVQRRFKEGNRWFSKWNWSCRR